MAPDPQWWVGCVGLFKWTTEPVNHYQTPSGLPQIWSSTTEPLHPAGSNHTRQWTLGNPILYPPIYYKPAMITPVDAHNPISIKNMNEWSPKYFVFKYTHRLNDKLIQSDMYRLLDPSVTKEQDKSMNRDEGSYQLSHILTSCSPRNWAVNGD